MKNVLKARIAPLCGIIAMIAVIMVMTACGGEEEAPPAKPAPAGPVSIFDEYGPFIGYVLKGIYEPEDGDGTAPAPIVTYLWLKDEDRVAVLTGDYVDYTAFEADVTVLGEQNTYTPSAIGTYTVAVVDNDDWTNFKNATTQNPASYPEFTFADKPINITAPDTNIIKFYGKWKTTQPFAPVDSNGNVLKVPDANGKPTSVDEPSRDENIDFTYRGFKLVSTYAGNPWYEIAGNDMNASYEYITFYINSWSPKTTGLPTGYTIGYTLSVKTDGYKGYTPYTSFYVVLNENGQAAIFRRSTNEGQWQSLLTRTYTLQSSLP